MPELWHVSCSDCVNRVPRPVCVYRSRLQPSRARRLACNATPTGLRIAPWTGAPREQQAYDQLMRKFDDSPYGRPTAEEAQWFLRDRSFDPNEAFEKLSTCLKWRHEFSLSDITYERIAAEAATGKAYLHAHPDIYGRPTLVIRVARHKVGQFSERQSQELCAYYIEKAIAARPSGVDNVIGVFDLSGFSLENADFGFVRFLIQAFFFYYPKRAGEVLMVDAPWAFMPPFEVMRPLLGKYADLIRFVSRTEARRYFRPGEAPPELS